MLRHLQSVAVRLAALASLATVAVLGCAYPVPPTTPGPSLRGWPEAVDWEAAGREAAQVLSAYLQIDTRNPPGNETPAARWLADVLHREGIAAEIIEFAPGRGSLVARLAGAGPEAPLCLLSHLDVAGADPREWPAGRGPLSGTIDAQGQIWGRGALDMKGMGALELMTLIWLKRLGVPLRREVVLIAVADEEMDNQGMRHLVAHEWSRLRCGHLVNEGGIGLRDLMFKGQTVFAVSVAEKGVLWLRLTVPGVGGHGSTPRVEHTPQRLLEVVERLRRRRAAVHIDPSLYELVARVGAHHGGLGGFVLQRPALVDTFMHGRLLGHPATRAAITDTVALTGLACDGGAPNVIPSSATLVLDCRLLPGTRPAAVVAELGRLVGDDPKVRFEVLAAVPARGNPWDDPFYRALARHVVAGRTDAVAGPALSVGFTDSIFAREQGTRAYGLVPFDLEQAEAATMHGVGERVSVANVTRGLKVLFSAVVEVAADLAGAGPRGGVARPPARPLPPPPVELPAASTRPPPASRFAAPGSRE